MDCGWLVVGRAEMSTGMIWAMGVDGAAGWVFGGSKEEEEGLGLWIRKGEGRRARFWLGVREADEVVEKGDSIGFRPLWALLSGVDGSTGSDVVLKSGSCSFTESVEDAEEG